ncbi:Leucine-rich repeat-containing N-terminal, type 2 [Cynara cardunculus var. scolymus]|uniref:Leucine-rich repeat-containing N-terminal, type 2 n=1 Tax=Cynara cardunculus var. scolymus TaxID=59895 RepID=A0A103YMQ7_CYNCS|nr:Leucine-rich repeat-containing N-terminal, type 2 [Cynara cardunculus var. scolymus]
MLAHSIVLLLLLIIHVNGSDSETLIEFKDSLINGDNLTTWTDSSTPCNNNRPNWEGLLCTNGNIWGIKLEGKGLEGSIDPTILARLPSLVSISFKNNSLEGSLPDFRKLDGMREIFLSNNKFYGEIKANAFNGLNRLTKLYLANNQLMGHIPLSLTTLPKLKELLLENNHFDGQIPNFDQGKLTLANFANNHFHGRIPEGLRDSPATRFSGNGELCGTPLTECQRAAGTSTSTIIVIAVVVAIAVAAVIFAVIILSRHHHHHHQQLGPAAGVLNQGSTVLAASANLSMQEKGGVSAHNGKKVDLSMQLTFLRDDVETFDLADLLKASAEILGSGMFGSSYKTTLDGGKLVVVKRFKQMNNARKEEFCKHMARLGSLRHPNLITLVAFYYRKEEKLLVSDYIDNISLAFHLHVKGVVRGLQNLYNKLPSLIVPHGHLKSSNVLLNKNYEPLLTDYGLVPLTNPELARDLMMAYKSPEYKQIGRISKRTDIWCLGILILEIMTGKIPTLYQGKGNDTDLADFINSVADQEFSIDMFDKEMTGFDKSNEGEMMKLLKIGLSCCETDTNKRMEIKQVVERIEEVKEKDSVEEDFYSTYSSETDKGSSIGHSGDFTN